MTQLSIFLIASILSFIIIFGSWYVEWRIGSVFKFIRNESEKIIERIHNDSRKYYEHRKNINHRIGKVEEKLSVLHTELYRAELDNEISELESKLRWAKDRKKGFEEASQPCNTKGRKNKCC